MELFAIISGYMIWALATVCILAVIGFIFYRIFFATWIILLQLISAKRQKIKFKSLYHLIFPTWRYLFCAYDISLKEYTTRFIKQIINPN